MNWFEKLSELVLSKLQKSQNGFISREDILDIIDSNVNYEFEKTLFYAYKYIEDNPKMERQENGIKLI